MFLYTILRAIKFAIFIFSAQLIPHYKQIRQDACFVQAATRWLMHGVAVGDRHKHRKELHDLKPLHLHETDRYGPRGRILKKKAKYPSFEAMLRGEHDGDSDERLEVEGDGTPPEAPSTPSTPPTPPRQAVEDRPSSATSSEPATSHTGCARTRPGLAESSSGRATPPESTAALPPPAIVQVPAANGPADNHEEPMDVDESSGPSGSQPSPSGSQPGTSQCSPRKRCYSAMSQAEGQRLRAAESESKSSDTDEERNSSSSPFKKGRRGKKGGKRHRKPPKKD